MEKYVQLIGNLDKTQSNQIRNKKENISKKHIRRIFDMKKNKCKYCTKRRHLEPQIVIEI